MCNRYSIFLFILLGSFFYNGQSQNYRSIDSAMRIQKASSIEQLVQVIKSKYNTPKEQLRAVFSWMVNHIDYDVPGFYNDRLYNPQWSAYESDSMKREFLYQNQVARRVFKERKGVCTGYSKLFMTLCAALGIESKQVDGFGKTAIGKPTATFSSNHEWNLVKIDGKWQPVDVTWAAGYTDFGKGVFHREINDHYYLTDPGLLLVDHYPSNKSDALLPWVPSFTQFNTRPMVYREFWNLHPTAFSASSGLYKFSDTAMTLNFTTSIDIHIVQIVTLPSNKQEVFYPAKGETVHSNKNFVSFTTDGKMKIRFRPAKNTDKKAIVFINGHAVMEFLISN